MLRPKKCEIRKKLGKLHERAERKTKCLEIEPNPSKDRAVYLIHSAYNAQKNTMLCIFISFDQQTCLKYISGQFQLHLDVHVHVTCIFQHTNSGYNNFLTIYIFETVRNV
jgi:hypothetical protein